MNTPPSAEAGGENVTPSPSEGGERDGPLARQLLNLRTEVTQLNRKVNGLIANGGQDDGLADTVSALAAQLQEFSTRLTTVELEGQDDPGSKVWDWSAIMFREHTEAGRAAWAQLNAWVRDLLEDVYEAVGFVGEFDDQEDGTPRMIPGCWRLHRDLIMELGWLCQEWLRVYTTSYGTPARAGDWHDRYWPGLRRRVATSTAAKCVKEHQARESDQRG